MKVFLSKIDKDLIDLALPIIIMNNGGQPTLVEPFAVVKQCDRTLYQYDAINLVSLLVDSSKFFCCDYKIGRGRGQQNLIVLVLWAVRPC